MADDIPVIMTKQGALPTPPTTLLAKLLALVSASNPGYTANLPGSLVEDISSTDVGALTIQDSARVDAINSLTPFGANLFVLNLLGSIYGVQQGVDTNTSVFEVFSGTVGFEIPRGFAVSDGQHQFIIQDGGIIGSGGSSAPLFAVASDPGAFPVPAHTVVNLITSVPAGITLSVDNPLAGTPAVTTQSEADYRAQVLQAGLAASQGMPRYLKTLLQNVPGVQARLVSVRKPVNVDGWQIIVGGTADPYQVAQAIFEGLFDITDLIGSSIVATAITNANPMQITTDLNHGFASGNLASLAGASPGAFDFTGQVVTVIDEKTFTVPIDSTGFGAYAADSGVVTPNARNQIISIFDYPDTYAVPFVVPPQQTVVVDVTWNTTAPNVVADQAIAAAGSQALSTYINSIAVGQPINVFEMTTVFQAAIADILAPVLLTRLVFAVEINGVPTSPDAGTGIIEGDPESYFFTDPTQIVILRG